MKKLITLFEISSNDFKSKISSLGYSEKGNELTSGGSLNSDLLDILSLLFDEWKKSNPNCPIKFTSGNDAFHHRITTYVSRHTKGEAVDLTLDKSCHPAFIALLNSYKSKYNGFNYIDEYTHPTAKATAGHFHLSYRNGAPEGSGKDYSSSEGDAASNIIPTSANTIDISSTNSSDLESLIDAKVKGDLTGMVNGIGKAVNTITGVAVNESKIKRISEQINRIKGLM